MSDVETTVSITVDGKPVDARPGELVIDACERDGTFIPRFCYHPRMTPVGMCRMCIVEIDTGRGPALQPSCMIPVSDGMTVSTDSEVTKKAQDGVLEFLLANHPLDCPVCDKGGECPLQDQAYSHGPGESRFVEEKRHFEKPIPISDLVNLDRERCILCDRCTRFADEVAGDTLIHFQDRGNQTQVNTFPDHPFASYFSGNTVQICPVGALTAEPYRFKARPWDLDQVESTCDGCSVGCRTIVQASRNRVLRYQGVDIDPVNWSWLCDKGRFGFEAVNSDARLTGPMVEGPGGLVETTWSDALTKAAAAIKSADPSRVAVIGGARLTNEDAYAWAKLAKGVIGTDNVDSQLGDGLPAELVLGLPRATIDEACAPGGTILLLGVDPKEELPVLFIRLRHAVVNDGATLVEIVPTATGASSLATATLVYAPGHATDVATAVLNGTQTETGGVSAESIAGAAAALGGGGPLTVIVGRGNIAEPASGVAGAAAAIANARPDAKFLVGLRRANSLGALDAGLAPGILPGRVSLDAGRSHVQQHWSTAPSTRGMNTHGILHAAADAKIDVLVLLGADPLDDYPDRALATRALAGARTVIALDRFPTASVKQAQIVFPVAGTDERNGTVTNIEGRISRVGQKVTPPGTARQDWAVAAELAFRLGDDLGVESPADLFDEFARVAPTHAGLTMDHVVTDGVVVPLPVAAAPADVDADTDSADGGVDETAAEAKVAADAADDTETRDAAEAESAEAQADAASEAEQPDVASPRAATGPSLIGVPEIEATPVPAADGYKLRLVATRKLYDLGTDLANSESMSSLAAGATLRLHPHDFDRLGVAVGGSVTVSNSEGGRGSFVVPVVADAAVPKGGANLAVNQPGGQVSDLIDITKPVTDVRVEVKK